MLQEHRVPFAYSGDSHGSHKRPVGHSTRERTMPHLLLLQPPIHAGILMQDASAGSHPIVQILNSWGLFGTMGAAGCYCIYGAIIGAMGPLPLLISKRTPVKTKFQRSMLAFFGAILAVPVIFAAYSELVFGVKTKTFSPLIDTEVAEPNDTSHSSAYGLPVAHVRFASQSISQPRSNHDFALGYVTREFLRHSNCRPVESFGLKKRQYRQLQYSPFNGDVFVYVGDIPLFGGTTELYIFSPSADPWPSQGSLRESEFSRRIRGVQNLRRIRFKGPGANISFIHNQRRYTLTVTGVYAVVFGGDRVALEICEQQ